MQRKKALLQLDEARARGEADEKIGELVDAINSSESMYTTSSCSGRITVLETPACHEKILAHWLGKWHDKVTAKDILDALSKHKKNVAYLQSECPIIHIACKDVVTADSLVLAGRESGFKRGGILSVRPERVMVELCSTENLEVPIGKDGKSLVSEDYTHLLTDIANIKLVAGWEKIENLKARL